MTRDISGLREDRNENDADVFGALWAVATFPRLPVDAPDELKKLTIDIDDPKRVYAIHRASRRHNFNVLIERFILQVRYGCETEICTTSTCFSCRRRLAGGAPVRRYNATSARTLAIYLASQDNPERFLCQHPGVRKVGIKTKTASPQLVVTKSEGRLDRHAANIREEAVGDETALVYTNKESNSQGVDDATSYMNVEPMYQDISTTNSMADPRSKEKPPKDHRSFVQNVFETAAFRMVQWLTPRNFDNLARYENDVPQIRANEDPTTSLSPPALASALANIPKTQNEEDPAAQPIKNERPILTLEPEEAISKISPRKRSTRRSKPSTNESKTTGLNDPKTRSNFATTQPSHPHARRRPDSVDIPNLKGILTLSPKSETIPDILPLSRDILPNGKRRTSRQTLITSPQLRGSEIGPLQAPKPLPGDISETRPSRPTISTDGSPPQSIPTEEGTKTEKIQKSPPATSPSPLKPAPLPQTLSYLPIEVIDLLCDILQTDDTDENHFLQPRRIYEGLKRRRNDALALKRRPSPETISGYPRSLRKEWHAFIEQSIFDVLCKPESLLQTFGRDDEHLYDTQTIWYMMLRMTRVAPSLVLDSLWGVAGTLFLPSQKLGSLSDWSKDPQSQNAFSQNTISTIKASQIFTVCVHALVAAVPLTTNARQLANMSRIRSYGLAMIGSETLSMEPVNLCLQYDDVFSDELALRLARRLFAAIPTRRRYGELLEVQRIHSDDTRESDMLDTVLDNLKFLDLGIPSELNFPDAERDIHEKRVPTLILDWARTIMLQDWEGTAEIPSDGSLGGALAMVAAIYKNRKSLLLGDIHFRTEFFAERLDPVETPLQWLELEPNKRIIHLLDYPFLFHPSNLVTYFRAINYSSMNRAYEQAKATTMHMRSLTTDSQLMADSERREQLLDRMSIATSRFVVLEIRRSNVLLDTFNAIWRREERELMRPLKIKLGEEGGEEGMDSGGVQQEFFRLAISEALNPDYGTFTVDDRTKMTWFQPGSPEPLWKFELIGMIFSLAVYNGLTLPVTFPRALYRKLLGEEVTELHHISDGWPDLANGLTTLLEWDENDGYIEDVFARTYEFSVEQFGKPISREMGATNHWPQFGDLSLNSNPNDAPMVTNENRNAYVSDYIKWLTEISINPQFEAFRAGFFSCINRRSISLFDSSTFQSIVEGIQEIDIPELRRATRYIGWEASHRTIRDFWSIVKKYNFEDKKRLLEFVTASDRVPVGGMRNLQFTVQRNGVDDGHLPSSYTCFGILLLPEYSSKDVLRQKLAMALENSKGFGFA